MIIVVTLGALLGGVLAGCAQEEAQARQVVQSEAQREGAPEVSSAEMAELVSGNSAFAWELYQELRGEGGNLFYSPYSMSAALAMTYAGARGETERQMAETLHFTLAQERLHAAFNALDLALNGQSGEDFRLSVVNSLWGQVGDDFLPQFLDTLAANYGAGLRLLDFAAEPEPARQEINEWVSQQTRERVKDLIPQGAITPITSLVLANAIYFDAQWQSPFSAELTGDSAFYTLDGGQTTAQMMRMSAPAELSYAQGQGYQAVELPYAGGHASMLLIAPDQGQFEAFEAGLDAGQIEAIVKALEPKQVALTMPKFTYESQLDLAETLTALGMPDAFGGAADFSGMDGTRELFIGGVYHKAYVAVDEAGTEAAAATAVVMQRKGIAMPDVELTVDRPFVLMIRDMQSGALLFVGRVVNPG
jgi:serpin B